MNKMKINVTKSDIAKSDKGRHIDANYMFVLNCPIAGAIQRTHKLKYGSIIVGKRVIRLCSSEGEINFDLPPTAKKFIDRYDKKLPVKPFSFTANLSTL